MSIKDVDTSNMVRQVGICVSMSNVLTNNATISILGNVDITSDNLKSIIDVT